MRRWLSRREGTGAYQAGEVFASLFAGMVWPGPPPWYGFHDGAASGATTKHRRFVFCRQLFSLNDQAAQFLWALRTLPREKSCRRVPVSRLLVGGAALIWFLFRTAWNPPQSVPVHPTGSVQPHIAAPPPLQSGAAVAPTPKNSSFAVRPANRASIKMEGEAEPNCTPPDALVK